VAGFPRANEPRQMIGSALLATVRRAMLRAAKGPELLLQAA
jgi:hypothetical protein